MIIKSAEFVTSAVQPDQYPPPDLPEIAFAGRSNVGKSSLINALVQRRHLVKTSSTPGRTQLVNFFRVNDTLCLVDLPGYGFARVPRSVRRTWGPMIETYLLRRTSLRAVVLILDMRRTPQALEADFIDWLTLHQRGVIVVLTKADKLSGNKRAVQRKQIVQALGSRAPAPVLFSAKTGQGRDALWKAIGAWTGQDDPEGADP